VIALAWAVPLVFFLAGWTIPTAIGIALAVFVTSFFRDPERTIPADPGAIVAPADGRVVKVADVHDDRFLHGPARLVCIFMSPLNVHVNRVPASGRVTDVRYNSGKYFRAFADKASLENEQNAILMQDSSGRSICFVQIAGFIARRIVCRLRSGDEVVRGQRFGLIMFGSRADIYLPRETEVCVQVGDNARGGETVIARWL
jgi:phosphatidylserine decarboxylase